MAKPKLVTVNTLPALPKYGDAVSAEDVLRIEDEVKTVLPVVNRIDEADDWRRRAKAIESYLRSPEMQRPILGAQRRIEARIGQLLGPAEMGRPDKSHHDETLIPNSQDRADFRLMARALTGECRLEVDEWRKSRRSLVALIRLKLGLMPESPDLPAEKFNCISADPPWIVTTGPEVFHGTGERGNEDIGYPQMSVNDICSLVDKNGRFVTECFADDAHLYLWTINRYVEASYSVARAWGFEPKTLLTWCKEPRGVGLGGTFKLTSEFILYCTRGSLEPRQKIPTTWFKWPRGRHSEKPKEAYQMFESVTPGARLALFEREQREGWACWGDEIGNKE